MPESGIDNRPNTNKTYQTIKNSLLKLFNTTNYKFLSNYKKTVDVINKSDYSESTKKLMYVVIAQILEESDSKKTLIDKYRLNIHTINKNIQTNVNKNIMNDKQKSNYMSYDELIIMLDHLKNKSNDRDGYLNYMIIALYVLQPPRRLDYALMKVTNNIKDVKNKDYNYLLNENTFVFNNYKTFKKYGIQVFKINDKLQDIIKVWLHKYNIGNEYLLNDLKKKSFTTKQLSKKIIDICFKYNNKNCSVDGFRHAYISHFLDSKPSTELKQNIANFMSHSMLLQSQYDKHDL